MVIVVGFVVTLLLIHTNIEFAHGNQFMLKGNQTDGCFQPSQKATAECLQELIESYYDKSFTKNCPGFSQVLAEYRCT